MTRAAMLSATSLDIPETRKVRVSGYTSEPNGYDAEIVDAEEWKRFQAGDGSRPLKKITDWVICEEWDGEKWIQR
jgi:hypothetical protein